MTALPVVAIIDLKTTDRLMTFWVCVRSSDSSHPPLPIIAVLDLGTFLILGLEFL